MCDRIEIPMQKDFFFALATTYRITFGADKDTGTSDKGVTICISNYLQIKQETLSGRGSLFGPLASMYPNP